MKKLQNYLVEMFCKTQLFEMAYNRSKYQDNLDSLTDQLVQNWCLVRYCSAFDENNRNRSHWKQELYSHISNIQRMLLKVDKFKATQEVLIGWRELNDADQVIRAIDNKWYDERLDIDAEYTDIIVSDFIEYGVDELIKILSEKSLTRADINDYINNI